MMKFVIVIFAIVCCSPQAFGLWRVALQILDDRDTDIIQVRTAKELELAESSDKLTVLDFIGLVEQHQGYTAEEHEVETSDGYILKLHRVSGSPSSPAAYGKPVVYLGYGLFASSDFFAVVGPGQSLLYMLADAGYDIWIGNYRGNTYSKRHKKYSPNGNNRKFWDFSMDELGLIDLPLFIDTILQKTNKTKLSYIGYSMGNTLSAILLSEKPQYNDKMHVVINIAPMILITPPYSPIVRTIRAFSAPMKALGIARRKYEVLPQSKPSQANRKDLCVADSDEKICLGILSNLVDTKRMNKTLIPTVFKYIPAGTSIFTVDQYGQFIRNGKFQHYDHGFYGNFIKYGSVSPPEYDLTKVTSPQVLFYSETDIFSNDRIIRKLNSTFPNVVALEKLDNFNHLDYMWLGEAKEVVYERTLEILRQHSKE